VVAKYFNELVDIHRHARGILPFGLIKDLVDLTVIKKIRRSFYVL